MYLEIYSRGNGGLYALGVYPAPGNYQEEFMLDQADWIINECGLDGFYTDEFGQAGCLSYKKLDASGSTVDDWDGVSVNMDKTTGEIRATNGKYVDCSIVGVDARLAVIDFAMSDPDRIHIGNTYATSSEENGRHSHRFAETQGSVFPEMAAAPGVKPGFLPALGQSQIGTPIGLGATAPTTGTATAEMLMNCLRVYLRHGMVYYHYVFPEIPLPGETGGGEYGPIINMFPHHARAPHRRRHHRRGAHHHHRVGDVRLEPCRSARRAGLRHGRPAQGGRFRHHAQAAAIGP